MGKEIGGYQVSIDKIRKAAKSIRDVSDEAAGMDVSGALKEELPAGMPGSSVSARATKVADRWQNALLQWVSRVSQYGDKLAQCADFYEHHEAAAMKDLQSTYYEIGVN